jgi:hypothetical protein
MAHQHHLREVLAVRRCRWHCSKRIISCCCCMPPAGMVLGSWALNISRSSWLQPLELLIFLVVVDCKKHGDAGDIARSAVSPRLSELLPREGEMDGLALAEDRSFLEIWNPRLSLSRATLFYDKRPESICPVTTRVRLDQWWGWEHGDLLPVDWSTQYLFFFEYDPHNIFVLGENK